MFQIEFMPEVWEELELLRKYDQARLVEEIETQLTHEPTRETRKRQRLRPNQLAEWELRVEDFRVFYDVSQQEQIVCIVAIGQKTGNTLFIRGERFEI